VKEVLTEASKRLVDEFLLSLKTILEQKRFRSDLKLIRRHSKLYRFYIKNKPHFLFIHASRGKEFFEIPSPGKEISHFISSENMDWSVILLKEHEGKNHPLGFLIPRDDFIKESGFAMNRMGLMRIKKKDLSSKYQFNSWDNFFQLLNV
jgi:hypothetical protein